MTSSSTGLHRVALRPMPLRWPTLRFVPLHGLPLRWLTACMGALLCLCCAAPAPRIETPSLRVVDLRPLPGGALEQRLAVDLLIANPNDFDLVLDGMRMALMLSRQPLGRGLSNERITLPRLAESRVTVELSVTLFDVVLQLLQLSESESLNYELRGDFFIEDPSSTTLSFRQSGTLAPKSTR